MHKRRDFTVFVDNLPCNLDRYGLRGIFQRAGKVSDSYIPSKLGRSRKRFGFVRFGSEKEAVNSIRWLNGVFIRGSRIRVCRARFGKIDSGVSGNGVPRQKLKMKPRTAWRIKSIQADSLNQRMHEELATVKGDSNGGFVEWLNNSLIGVSNEVWDLEDLTHALVNEGYPKIRALSKFKFILTYQTSERKEEVLKNHVNLAKWFHEVKNWDIYEVCETRRFWLEVFGVPPHGWTLRNFESIASFWGKLVCLETPIDDTISFESMKILVESNSFQEVFGHLILQIGDAGFRIMVKEASCSFAINPQFIVPASSSSTGAIKVIKGNSGQALRGDGVSNHDVNKIQGANVSRMDSTNSVEVARGASLFEFEREVGQCAVNVGVSNNMSNEASSKTKTAQLSGKGYSEEMAMMFPNVTDHQGKKLEGASSPGLTIQQQGIKTVSFEEGKGENLIPPGFEAVNETGGEPTRKGKIQKGQLAFSGKRLTRSQAKARKETGIVQSTSNKKGVDSGTKAGSPQVSKATSNSDSLTKLAKEAFEMGELLGVRVIGNKDEAIKSFAETLRKDRDSRLQHPKPR